MNESLITTISDIFIINDEKNIGYKLTINNGPIIAHCNSEFINKPNKITREIKTSKEVPKGVISYVEINLFHNGLFYNHFITFNENKEDVMFQKIRKILIGESIINYSSAEYIDSAFD